MIKRKSIIACVVALCVSLSGCSFQGFNSGIQEMKGSIKGCTYDCSFYTNSGELFMIASGQNIDISENIVEEKTYSSDGGWGYTETLSSVLTLTIDGKQIESCGSTIIFADNRLEKDVDFQIQDINSTASGLGDWTSIAKLVNNYKNYFGKASVVVIQSQLGDLICAYSGNDVYWEVCQDLPKTTKLMIDGKALYIHRANFQIIDSALLK